MRVIVDGDLYDLSEDIVLEKNIKHNIRIVVDRLVVKEGIEKRLTDSIENILHLTSGLVEVDVIDGENFMMSEGFACPDCGISVDEVEPRSFSFNNPFGACPECFGLGFKMEFDEDLMIPDKRLSFNEGCVTVMGWQSASDKRVSRMRSWLHWQRNTDFLWIRLSRTCRRRYAISSSMDLTALCRCIIRGSAVKAFMISVLRD